MSNRRKRKRWRAGGGPDGDRSNPPDTGGLGGDPALWGAATAENVALVRQAVREGWPTDPATSANILKALFDGCETNRAIFRYARLVNFIDRKLK